MEWTHSLPCHLCHIQYANWWHMAPLTLTFVSGSHVTILMRFEESLLLCPFLRCLHTPCLSMGLLP